MGKRMKSNRRNFLKQASVYSAGVTTLLHTNSSYPQTRQPNILFFFPDQHRYDWVGFHSDIPVNTPVLDSLAKRGVRFTQAFCPSPLCAPSRSCLAGGVEYDHCPVKSNGDNQPADEPTIYSRLRDAGYYVMGCGKFDLHKATQNWGLDGKRLLNEWGFSDGIDNAGKWDAINSGREKPKDPYMGYLHKTGLVNEHVADFLKRRKGEYWAATFPTPLPNHAYCDNWIAQNGLDLIRSAPHSKPWFIQVNFAGPHDPLDVTVPMKEWYRDVEFPQPIRNTEFDDKTHHEIRQNYSAMVENIDQWFGIYIDEIAKRGELDNTIIVFSSDHGEMLGDHNRWAKKQPYQASVGVPLVIAGPGIKQNITIDKSTTILDLSASFLDYGQAKPLSKMDSISLRPVLEGQTESRREVVLSGLSNWRMVDDSRYKLITGYGKEGTPILFDRQQDPKETKNIAKQAPEIVKRLKKHLLT